MKDWFEVLDVKEDASIDDVTKAYHKLVREWHPDKNSSPEAVEKIKEINSAYGEAKLLIANKSNNDSNLNDLNPEDIEFYKNFLKNIITAIDPHKSNIKISFSNGLIYIGSSDVESELDILTLIEYQTVILIFEKLIKIILDRIDNLPIDDVNKFPVIDYLKKSLQNSEITITDLNRDYLKHGMVILPIKFLEGCHFIFSEEKEIINKLVNEVRFFFEIMNLTNYKMHKNDSDKLTGAESLIRKDIEKKYKEVHSLTNFIDKYHISPIKAALCTTALSSSVLMLTPLSVAIVIPSAIMIGALTYGTVNYLKNSDASDINK